jgi:hypothetical protein
MLYDANLEFASSASKLPTLDRLELQRPKPQRFKSDLEPSVGQALDLSSFLCTATGNRASKG